MTEAEALGQRIRLLVSPVPGVSVFELRLVPQPGDAGTALLDEPDRRRLDELAPALARALLTRRALVAQALASLLDVPTAALSWTSGGGQRWVSGGDRRLAVSLSTSGERGLLVVAARPVGVDLEREAVLPDAHLVADALLPPQERAWITAAATPEELSARFLRTWVRKEAVVKATGEGLAGRDPRTFVVDATGGGPRPVHDAAGRPLGLCTVDLLVPGAHAALACGTQPTGRLPRK